MLFSAIASFSVASVALVPQWRAYLALPDWVPVNEISRNWSTSDWSVSDWSIPDWSVEKWLPDGWRNINPTDVLAFLKGDADSGRIEASASRTSASSASDAVVSPGMVAQHPDSVLFTTRFARCPEFFPGGHMPAVAASYAGVAQSAHGSQSAFRELCFSAFAVLHNGDTRTPVFVAQRLNRGMLQQAQSVQRRDRFYEEARLPARERARLEDYRGSGYSRGHMAPAGDMHTEEGMAQSFSLANMVPQDQRQNAGPWNQIEQATRRYIMRAKGDVYVFTGPVYQRGVSHTIGQGKVAVPDYLYKVVYDPNTQRSWVHWQPNTDSAKAGPPISYAEFVKRTGLHLLPSHQLNLSERESSR